MLYVLILLCLVSLAWLVWLTFTYRRLLSNGQVTARIAHECECLINSNDRRLDAAEERLQTLTESTQEAVANLEEHAGREHGERIEALESRLAAFLQRLEALEINTKERFTDLESDFDEHIDFHNARSKAAKKVLEKVDKPKKTTAALAFKANGKLIPKKSGLKRRK